MHTRNSNNSESIYIKILKNRTLLISIASLFLLLLFLKFKSIVLFIVICLIAAAINYFIHTTSIHLHLGHVSFLAVIFSYTLGWQYGIAMIVIAHVLAELLAGHADMELFNTGIIYVINVFLAFFLNGMDIVALGIGLTVFQAIATTILGFFTGAPIHEIITEDGLEFVMLMFYYLTISRSLILVIG